MSEPFDREMTITEERAKRTVTPEMIKRAMQSEFPIGHERALKAEATMVLKRAIEIEMPMNG